MSKLNCSDQIINYLQTLDIKRIYGIPGDAIDSMMESLRKQDAIQFIIMRHEEMAAFAAVGESKLSEELSVIAACQGPGANHIVNALYDAKMDKVPLLAITGQVDTDVVGTQMPQETNQYLLFEDCTIFNAEVRSASNLPIILEQAVSAAINKQGPAHISIPSDIMRQKAIPWQFTRLPNPGDIIITPSKDAIAHAAQLINQTSNVCILYGEGARGAQDVLATLSKTLQAPLVHTTRSKDIIDDNNQFNLGGIGIMGSKAGNKAVHTCDLLIIIGSRFAWREFYPENKPIIQIDNDPCHTGSRTAISNPLIGDSKKTLINLLPLIEEKNDTDFFTGCLKLKDSFLTRRAFDAKKTKPNKPVHPQAFMSQLGPTLTDNAVICCDSGSITVWANNILAIKPQQHFIWNANLASLGNALPYAIGCQLAEPDRQVICLAGDGGFQMSLSDLTTLSHYNLPIICIVYNNATFGFIELEEQGEGNIPFGTQLVNPDYAKLAEAHGITGYTINDYDDISDVLRQAMTQSGPCLINVHINPDELIIPPVIHPKQALEFSKSRIKHWFSDIKH